MPEISHSWQKQNSRQPKILPQFLVGSEIPGGQNLARILARILPRFLKQNVAHVAMWSQEWWTRNWQTKSFPDKFKKSQMSARVDSRPVWISAYTLAVTNMTSRLLLSRTREGNKIREVGYRKTKIASRWILIFNRKMKRKLLWSNWAGWHLMTVLFTDDSYVAYRYQSWRFVFWI